MDFQEAKQYLKEQYTTAGLELVEESDESIMLRYQDATIAVCQDDIDAYARFTTVRDRPETAPVECGICSLSYREQVVQPLDPIRWWHLPPLETGFVLGDSNKEDPYVAIGRSSKPFVNHFRFNKTYMQIALERIRYASGIVDDIRDLLYYPPTIKVYNLSERSIKDALQRSDDVINAALFQLSSLKNMPVGLADMWPPRRRSKDEFQYGGVFEGNQLPLTTAAYVTDAVNFYQLGLSSNMPVMQFQAYYKVLELFFIQVSDEALHQKMSRRLNDPRFHTTAAQLNRLIQDVLDHVDEIDRSEMIRHVIEKFIDLEDLCEFIQSYEKHIESDMYTRRRRLFGEDVQVKISVTDVADGVARTIVALHDALMISPDRGSRTARSVSFNDLTESLKPEIPLMRYLAEQVIIASAS